MMADAKIVQGPAQTHSLKLKQVETLSVEVDIPIISADVIVAIAPSTAAASTHTHPSEEDEGKGDALVLAQAPGNPVESKYVPSMQMGEVVARNERSALPVCTRVNVGICIIRVMHLSVCAPIQSDPNAKSPKTSCAEKCSVCCEGCHDWWALQCLNYRCVRVFVCVCAVFLPYIQYCLLLLGLFILIMSIGAFSVISTPHAGTGCTRCR
jgi:hypothetical protein